MPTWTLHYGLSEPAILERHYELVQDEVGASGAISEFTVEETSEQLGWYLTITTHTERPHSDELWQAILERQVLHYRPIVGFAGIRSGRPRHLSPNQQGRDLHQETREHLSQIVEESNRNDLQSFSPEERQRTLEHQLARAMRGPIHRSMDYQSVARRTFLVNELPPEALTWHNRIPEDQWIQPGVWARTRTKPGFYAKVLSVTVSVTDSNGWFVEFKIWRTEDTCLVTLRHFAETCELCDEPVEGPTWYERLLNESV